MPLVLLTYLSVPARHWNIVLAITSPTFDTYGALAFVLLLLACVTMNILVGPAIDNSPASPWRARYPTLVEIVDVSVLCYWKYVGFLTEQGNSFDQLFNGHGFSVIKRTSPPGCRRSFHPVSLAPARGTVA
jgi:alginate O-acetyltransferase complex protein AlgI